MAHWFSFQWMKFSFTSWTWMFLAGAIVSLEGRKAITPSKEKEMKNISRCIKLEWFICLKHSFKKHWPIFFNINVAKWLTIFRAEIQDIFLYEPILSPSFSQAVAQGFGGACDCSSIEVILSMALAGCPDYFLHHPNYQVNSSVVVVFSLKQWILQSFQVQQGTVSVFPDHAVISFQAEYMHVKPECSHAHEQILLNQHKGTHLFSATIPKGSVACPHAFRRHGVAMVAHSWHADMQSGGCCYLYPGCTVSPLSIFDSPCLLALSNIIPFI